MSDAEVPEADALDQARDADPGTEGERPPRGIPADVPDADALEQAREVPLSDDDRW